MIQKLKQALAQRQKVFNTDYDLVPSAVLVPIFYKEGEYYLLFTKRTEKVKVHKGQIAFPGGAYEEEDDTLLDTALRECTEEIGLSPDDVELLGELDDMPTMSSDFVISPFVAVLPWPYPFKIDPWEVEKIIEVPLSALLDKDCVRQETEILYGKQIPTYFYDYQGEVIWGASARILHQFLDIYTRVMADKGE
ncbi:putative Nudix hydrolase NudL [subsurface metagenome]